MSHNYVFTVDSNSAKSVLATTTTTPSLGAVQTTAQVPIKVWLGMEKSVQFSGNQQEGEEVAHRYISATFAFHEVEDLIKNSSPEDERLPSLRVDWTQKLEQLRQYQQSPLIFEFTSLIRDQ